MREVNMVPEIRDAWVENLTNGEYEQTTQVLHNVTENAYCCLGVLCDMAVKAGVIGEPFEKNMWISSKDADLQVATYTDSEGDYWTSVLPPEVIAWSGIGSDTGYFAYKTKPGTDGLAGLNDNGATFAEIANVIKENF